ncbi:hypothetical protein DOTSEDRAFT_54722 [Dothistroma septosporum NZE10]|uniref:Uncharacterized protein n=1 Tax=Dothistroma septosporum (strain NZE10 / CBS 128990) TaxID=675120 RepID=N1PI92_DOTSN|nr:hypothetical protein DOTSEDRAFT_54722 [Dothistroma septosporum NZE10]
MADDAKTAPKGWTDTEKMGLLLQIIAKMDKPVPWNEIDLPEGRTQKGCVVMLDKEKKKIRDALQAEGKELTPFKPKTPAKKRTKVTTEADGEDGGGSPKKKKPTPRMKKATAKAVEAAEKSDDGANAAVKEEPAADENAEDELI